MPWVLLCSVHSWQNEFVTSDALSKLAGSETTRINPIEVIPLRSSPRWKRGTRFGWAERIQNLIVMGVSASKVPLCKKAWKTLMTTVIKIILSHIVLSFASDRAELHDFERFGHSSYYMDYAEVTSIPGNRGTLMK